TEPARAFVQRHAAAASQAYAEGREALSEAVREQLLRVLVSFDSDIVIPAFVKAIEHYAQTGNGVDEAMLACQAAMQRAASEYQAPLLAAFQAVDTSDKDGLRYGRHLAAVMSYQRTPDWVPALVSELGKPLERPARFDDADAVKAYQSGLFRQTISARLLGELRATEATDPLLKVLLDPKKRELHPDAELSVIRLGPSLLPRLLTLLAAEDE